MAELQQVLARMQALEVESAKLRAEAAAAGTHEAYIIAAPDTRFAEPTAALLSSTLGLEDVPSRDGAARLSGNASPLSSAKATARLGAIVEHIFAPFERTPVPRLDGHYIGALYMQAVVPWLCAWRAGAKTDALATTVRRAGRAVCHWLKHAPGSKAELRRRVCERLHPDYVTLCSSPVWGGQDKDVVWRAFLA